MSKILRTHSSRQNEFIVSMSNFSTESPWLESDFLKQTIYTFEFFGLCIRLLASFNKAMCAVQNSDITDWIIVIFHIRNPQILKSIPLIIPNMYPKTKFWTSATSQLSPCCFSTEPNHSPGCNAVHLRCYQCRSKWWGFF